jgi:membrane-associated HD superfamily phosphohydrolase
MNFSTHYLWLLLLLFLIILLIFWMVDVLSIRKSYMSRMRLQNLAISSHLGTSKVTVLLNVQYPTHPKNTKIITKSIVIPLVKSTIKGLTDATLSWELIAKQIADHLYKTYNVKGVSLEFLVPFDSEDGAKNADVRTATYTVGSVYIVNRLDAQDT